MESRASFHAMRNATKSFNYVEVDFGVVHLGDCTRCNIVGKGDKNLNLSNGIMLRLKDVRYVPTLNHNLISFGQLVKFGMNITFTADS